MSPPTATIDPRPLARPALERARREVMELLAATLDRAGYRRGYPLVSGGGLFAPDLEHGLKATESLAPPDAALYRLFALGRAVRRRDLERSVLVCLEALLEVGLVSGPRNDVETTGWIVVPALGGLLLTGTPPTYGRARQVGASAYLGPDSLRLAAALPAARGRRVLDLGTGCGIQGLLGAREASALVLTDIEERSLELAALNAALNGTTAPCRYLLGDTYEPVIGERFDLIVSLPPYVPEIENAGTRSTVAAGADGLAVIRKIVLGAPDHLGVGGELLLRAQLFCDAAGVPILGRELDALPDDVRVELTLTNWHPLRPYVVDLATSLTAHGIARSAPELIAGYLTSLRALGATGVCAATLSLRRTPPTAARPALMVQRDGSFRALRLPPRRVEGYAIADAAGKVAVAAGRATVALDPPGAGLLAAVDGERSLDELIATAWGTPAGAAPADLRDAALARLGELARAELITYD